VAVCNFGSNAFFGPLLTVFAGIYREGLRLWSVENVQKISGLGENSCLLLLQMRIGMRSDRNGARDSLCAWIRHDFGRYLDKSK